MVSGMELRPLSDCGEQAPSGSERALCRFTHDAIRVGRHVFVCNTGDGQIVQLSFPSMTMHRTLDLFTAREHINTLAALDDSSIWAVLHNLGNVRLLPRRVARCDCVALRSVSLFLELTLHSLLAIELACPQECRRSGSVVHVTLHTTVHVVIQRAPAVTRTPCCWLGTSGLSPWLRRQRV